MDIGEQTTRTQGDGSGRSRRLWWWTALTLVGAVAVPVASTGRGVDAAPQRIAAACTGTTYTVVSGDGWYRIASKTSTAVSALLAANSATLSTPLFPGMRLCVAPDGVAPASSSTTSTTVVAPAPTSIAQFPVQGSCWYSDTFGAPRSGGRKHEGVDILAKSGQYIYAVADGVLTKQYIDAPGTLAGNGWRLTRSDGTYFFYAHLSAFAPGLKVGSAVKAGQIIGYVGKTGNAGAPHLHFEVHPRGGAAVNPTPIVKAVDGCSTTVVPPQPSTAPAATVPASTVPASTVPASTVPAPTVPAPTVPVTTTPVAVAPVASAGSRWTLVSPALVFDSYGAKLRPLTPVTVTVGGLGGVPAGTSGVLLRITARNSAGPGWVVAHDCAAGPNSTSSLSVRPLRLNATTTMAPVTGGRFCVTSSVAVDLRIFAVGYQSGQGLGVAPIPMKRAVDTRAGLKLVPGRTTSISPSALGVPRGSGAITATITLENPDRSGALGVGACGGSPWIVNFVASTTQVFSVVLPISSGGLCVTANAPVHLVIDVSAGWSSEAGGLSAQPPVRVFDSRPGGVGSPSTIAAGVPTGATRAQYTVTVVAGASSGSVFVWNCAAAQPTAAAASSPAGTVTSVTVTVDVAGGAVCVASSGGAHAVIDLVGAG